VSVASSRLTVTDFVGEAWWFILSVLAIGWICELIKRRNLRSKRKMIERNKLITREVTNIENMELAKGIEGPTRRSYWVVENRFAAGAYPGKKGHKDDRDNPEALSHLIDSGINVVVNLTQDYPGGTDEHLSHYDAGAKGKALIQRFPIVDVSIPTIDLMAEILDSINGHLAMGKNIYVHCWGGSGRTGTVVGCWLLESGLATTFTVLETVQNLRIGDLDGGHKPSPQTREQAEFILNWGA